MKLGSRTVRVGDKAWTKLSDGSSGVSKDDKAGELLGEDMPSRVWAIEEQPEREPNERGISQTATFAESAFYPILWERP